MTEPTDAGPSPCPFCGSSKVVHYEVEGRANHHFECCECLASSMCKPTYQEALAAWNRRAPQPTQPQAGAVPLTCEWTHNDDDSSWDTECGQSWRFDDGGPKENHMNFCHCCGKTLRIKGGQHGAE